MRIAPLFALTFALAACGMAGANEQKDPGPKITRDFDVSGFERVKLAGSDDVIIREGADFAVRAEGPEKIVERLEIEVEDGVLIIKRKKDSNWGWSSGKNHAVVTITMPVLRGASLAGSGDLSAAVTATDRFDASLAGSGDMTIADIRATQTNISLAGSGDISVKGKAQTVDYSLAGSGDIVAADLIAETISISLAGSGDVSAHASVNADVSMVGSGDVNIKGAAKCTKSKIGSGDISCG